MAKLALLLATLALFLLLAKASVYRTTVELDEEAEDDQLGQRLKCRPQYRAQQRLSACRSFIRQQRRSLQDQEVEDEVVEGIEEVVEPNQGGHGALLQSCCQQLQNITPPCRCRLMRRALGQVGGWPGSRLQVKKDQALASYIPVMCNLQPTSCPFGRL